MRFLGQKWLKRLMDTAWSVLNFTHMETLLARKALDAAQAPPSVRVL
jgi:hypothetical protein